MDKLRCWLAARRVGLDIRPKGEDCFVYEEGATSAVVRLNASSTKSERLFTALHECGHVQVWLGRRKRPEHRIAGCSLRELEEAKGRWRPRTVRRRLATMEEEIDAWTRGLRLARRLRIRLKNDAFEASRARALMTYARWLARR